MTLSWGALPSDLDLHLSRPDGTGGRFHVFYLNTNPTPLVSQDVDDVNGDGPENTTVTVFAGAGGGFVAGRYHVWVHNFAGDAPFTESTARLTLNGLVGQVLSVSEDDIVGDPTRRIWRAFEFDLSSAGTISNVTPLQFFDDGTDVTVL